MCRVLDVRPSGYYRWLKLGPCARAIADERLLLNIRIAHRDSAETYGAPRIHDELRGWVGSEGSAFAPSCGGRASSANIESRGCSGPPSQRRASVAPNVLDRQFDVNGIQVVNRVWVADITYVPTPEGFLFLAVVLDLASRRVVGWAMRNTLAAELALAALRMALEERQPEPGLVHHSDQGVHYTCTAYQELLATHGIDASIEPPRELLGQRAVAESFFATLERELIVRRRWATRAEAREAIFRYIATWYNTRRRHSTLGYRSPNAYERELLSVAA
jgi:putative transposase